MLRNNEQFGEKKKQVSLGQAQNILKDLDGEWI